jgi:hypothetical protein
MVANASHAVPPIPGKAVLQMPAERRRRHLKISTGMSPDALN